MASGDIHHLADEMLGVRSIFDPLNATVLGVPGYDGLLPDPYVEAERALRGRAAYLAARASVINRASLSDDDRITVEVVITQADALIDRIDARMTEFTVTDSNHVSAAATILSLMPMATVATAAQADAYLARLGGIPAYLEAVADRHRLGAAAGRVPVKRLVEAAVAQLDRYLDDPAGDPLLLPGHEHSAERARLVADVVRPAMARYRMVLANEIATRARADDRPGLCWLPEGGATYSALIRLHTTGNRTADDLHRLGLAVLDRLRGECAEVGARAFGTSVQDDSLRAARLVVDTGLHAKGWTRAMAITFMRENTTLSMMTIAGEVDRYIGHPGQALSYMAGPPEIEPGVPTVPAPAPSRGARV